MGERASTIAAFLQDSILTGYYRPGDRLPSEAALCAHFDVSRPTLREALGRLSALGLIQSRRGAGGGAFIARPTMQDSARLIATLVALAGQPARDGSTDAAGAMPWPETLLAARIQQQMACARLAAMTGADITAIRTEIDRQSDFALDDAGFHASRLAMHLAVCEASGNALLGMTGQALLRAHHAADTGAIDRRARARFLSFHVRLANGIAAGRPEDTDAALTELWYYEYDRLYAEAEPEAPEPEPNDARPPRMRDLRIPPVQRLGNPET